MIDVTIDNKVFTFCFLSTHSSFQHDGGTEISLSTKIFFTAPASSADYRSLNLNAYINKKDILIGR